MVCAWVMRGKTKNPPSGTTCVGRFFLSFCRFCVLLLGPGELFSWLITLTPQSRHLEYIMAAITLTPNMLHCVRTGLPLGRIPEQLDTVNQALTSGKYTAGMHVGHIRASDTTIEALKAKGVSLKRYWWATDTAKRIAAHNEATLNQHGFTADPSTKTKGQLPNRQYGVYAAPQPKVVQPNEVIDLLSGMAIVPDVDKSTLQPEPVKPPAIVMPKAPAWMDKPSTTVLPTGKAEPSVDSKYSA